jgi:hypothetical protein
MKWSRDHVPTLGYSRDAMLTVDLDRLNVIISGSVVRGGSQFSTFSQAYRNRKLWGGGYGATYALRKMASGKNSCCLGVRTLMVDRS